MSIWIFVKQNGMDDTPLSYGITVESIPGRQLSALRDRHPVAPGGVRGQALGADVHRHVAGAGGGLLAALALRQGCATGSDWSKRVNHHTLVYQYRLCYTMSLYCTGALSRSVT